MSFFLMQICFTSFFVGGCLCFQCIQKNTLHVNTVLSSYSGTGPPITDPPTSRQPLYNGPWLWHQMKLLQNLCLINLPRADASWFWTADKLHAPNWPTLYNSASYNGQTGNHTYNCILARTSHQRTTSEKRTKVLLPKCPLFGGSTICVWPLPRMSEFSIR